MLPDPKEARADQQTHPQLSILTEDGKLRQETTRRHAHVVQGTACPAAVSLQGPAPQDIALREATPGRPWDLGRACLPLQHGPRWVTEDETATWPGARGSILAGWGRGAGPSPEGRGHGALTSTFMDRPGLHRDPWTRTPA